MSHAPLPTPADFAEHHLNALMGKLRWGQQNCAANLQDPEKL